MPAAADPVLIVGQGLAGTLLAWRLERTGVPFHIADPGSPDAASRVAPGIINPLAGKRLNPSWRVAEQLPEALQTYRAIEQEFPGVTFFNPTPIVRVIKDKRQLDYFRKRRVLGQSAPWVEETLEPGRLGPLIDDSLGSFIERGSGWLDTAHLVQTLRHRWISQGKLTNCAITPDALQPDGSGWRWQSLWVSRVVFCEGWRAALNPRFTFIPFKPARGEMLELERLSGPFLPEHLENAILNRSKWLLPMGNNRYRAGASYFWDDFDKGPDPEMGQSILDAIREFVCADFRKISQVCGTRPIVDDYRPVLGEHPSHDGLFIFNGLGSKGVLSAPWLSALLANHLTNRCPLPDEVRVDRFWNQHRNR